MTWFQTLLNKKDFCTYRVLCFVDRCRGVNPKRLATKRCSKFLRSDYIEEHILYLTQVGKHKKWISFHCPGECGKVVRLPLFAKASPRWESGVDCIGRTTIIPSIRQLTSCKCHFWVRRGCIHWCADSGRPRRHVLPPISAHNSRNINDEETF